MIAQRVVVDHVRHVGGVTNVEMTKELHLTERCARQRYNCYVEDEKKKREHTQQTQKRKILLDEIDELAIY